MKNELKTPYMADDFPIIVKTCSARNLDRVEDAYKALHEAIEIKYFFEGSSTLLIGSEIYTAHAGDTVVINPYEFHATIAYGEVPGKYHIIMVDPDFFESMGADIPNLRNLLHGQHLHFKNHHINDKSIARILEEVVREAERKDKYFRLLIRGLMLELLTVLLRSSETDKSTEKCEHVHRFYETIEPALRKIRDAYSKHISAEELAAVCNVSKYYFCRVFKSVTAMPPMAYLLEYRLKVANAMLTNTAKSISQIAEETGFDDENYFSRCYKKRFGIPPGKKRKIKNIF